MRAHRRQLQILSNYIEIGTKAPIRVKFVWSDFGPYRLGEAGPNAFIPRECCTGDRNTSYPLALLVSQAGRYNVSTRFVLPGAPPCSIVFHAD